MSLPASTPVCVCRVRLGVHLAIVSVCRVCACASTRLCACSCVCVCVCLCVLSSLCVCSVADVTTNERIARNCHADVCRAAPVADAAADYDTVGYARFSKRCEWCVITDQCGATHVPRYTYTRAQYGVRARARAACACLCERVSE